MRYNGINDVPPLAAATSNDNIPPKMRFFEPDLLISDGPVVHFYTSQITTKYIINHYGFWSIFHSHIFLPTPQNKTKHDFIWGFSGSEKDLDNFSSSWSTSDLWRGRPGVKIDLFKAGSVYKPHCFLHRHNSHWIWQQLKQDTKGTEVAENSHPTLQNHFLLLPPSFTFYHQRHVLCNT